MTDSTGASKKKTQSGLECVTKRDGSLGLSQSRKTKRDASNCFGWIVKQCVWVIGSNPLPVFNLTLAVKFNSIDERARDEQIQDVSVRQWISDERFEPRNDSKKR